MSVLSSRFLTLTLRQAEPRDALGMAAVQTAIRQNRGQDAVSEGHILGYYVEHPERVSCAVALDSSGTVLGFQSLRRVGTGNRHDAPEGWGVIGTHIHPAAHRMGLGRALFAVTLAAARVAGLRTLDATIGATMPAALAYYEAVGFRTWREIGTAVGKRLDLRTGG